MAWQVQEAKQKFSELVQRTLDEGPQTITRRGEAVVVMVSVEEFQRLTGTTTDFKEFLLSGPDLSVLDIQRDDEPTRIVEL